MTSKEKIREILATYNDYTNNTDYPDWSITTLNYDDEEFDIYEEDVEKVKEIIKDLETLEILKPYLKQVVHIEETGGGVAINFKPTTFYIAKVMDLDFNFNDTEKIENIRKVKEWLDNEKV